MVVSAKNGSIVAVTGSGIRHMSDSLIAFQPAIEEPSNIRPSAKVSSSIMSTYLTSLSLIDFRTSLAVFMNTPLLTGRRNLASRQRPRVQRPRIMLNTIAGCSTQYQSVGSFWSDRVEPGLAGADANGFLDVGHEDLAVADPPGLGRAPDGVDRPLDQVIPDHDLDFHLGQKV